MDIFSTFFTPTYLFLFLNLIIGTIYITSRLAPHRPTIPHQPGPLGLAPSSLIDRVRSIDLSFYKFENHPEPDPLPGLDSAGVDGRSLARAPSLLDRFCSINFYRKKFEHPGPEPVHMAEEVGNSSISDELPPPPSRTSSLFDQLQSFNFYLHKSDQQANPEPVNIPNPTPLARAPSLLEHIRSIKFPSFYNPGEPNPGTESNHGNVDKVGLREDGEQAPKPRMRKTAREKDAAEDDVEVEGIDAKADDFIQRFRQQLRLQRLDSIMRYKDMLTGGGGATR